MLRRSCSIIEDLRLSSWRQHPPCCCGCVRLSAVAVVLRDYGSDEFPELALRQLSKCPANAVATDFVGTVAACGVGVPAGGPLFASDALDVSDCSVKEKGNQRVT